MIETFVENQIPAPTLIGRDDIQMWPLVYQRGAAPLVYVECRSTYEENTPLRIIFIKSIRKFVNNTFF